MTDGIILNLLVLGFFLGISPLLPHKKRWSRRIVVAIGLTIATRYMWWRLTETLLPVDPLSLRGVWYWLVFLCEFIVFLIFSFNYLVQTDITDWSPHADKYEAWLRTLPADRLPTVDVMIPTYNEDRDVLERTIVGALGLDYPRFTVWVLDDGRRDWLQTFCEERGARYLRRPDNKHAKAGNINHALTKTNGELFALFDADFIPRRDFLYRTIGFFFADPSIAIVQTPQCFMNPDPFQHNLGLSRTWFDDQRHWYEETLPARDAWDAAFCCGSCGILRRDVVMAVGGFPTDSVTEDMLLSLVLLRRGYITRYLNERLSMGLAPESLRAYVIQRRRWSRGSLQTLFLREGPLGPGRLSLWKRLIFLPTFWLIMQPATLIPYILPLAFLWLGLGPFPTPSMESIVLYQIPTAITLAGLSWWFYRHTTVVFLFEAQSLFAALRISPTVVATMYKPFGTPFKVTPKGASNTHNNDVAALYPAVFCFGAMALGLFLNWCELDRLSDRVGLLYASLWVVMAMAVLGLLTLISMERPRLRSEERFPIGAPAHCTLPVGESPCLVVDLSTSGALLDG
jgi:cellulose synthase (UDP-forming)